MCSTSATTPALLNLIVQIEDEAQEESNNKKRPASKNVIIKSLQILRQLLFESINSSVIYFKGLKN